MLLEMLVGMLAGAFLAIAVVQWYVSYTGVEGHSQRTIRELAALDRYVNLVQSTSVAVPLAGVYRLEGHALAIAVVADEKIPRFRWVSAHMNSEFSEKKVIEIVIGVCADAAAPRV